MGRVLIAGGLYFLVAFAAGFLLGIVRVLLIAPRVGALGAVAIELPIMLGMSWSVARILIRTCRVPSTFYARLAMGLVAFVFLQITEAVLGRYGFGRSWEMQLAALKTAAAVLGLAGQLVFAALPLLVSVDEAK